MNTVILSGNVAQISDLRTVSTEKGDSTVLNLSLAVNDKTGTQFFECEVWNGLSKAISENVKVGNKITVNGKILINKFTDSEGVNKTAYRIRVKEASFGFASNKSEEEEESK